MSEPINEEKLTQDIFAAESYGSRHETLAPREYRGAANADEVLQEYADKYSGGDVDQLQTQLLGQGYAVGDVVQYATQNPRGISTYRKLKRKAKALAPEEKRLESSEDVFNATPVFAGTEGVLSADVSPDEYAVISMNRTDKNYDKVLDAADIFISALPEADRADLLSRPFGYEFDSGFLRTATEKNLDAKGFIKGTQEYDDLYWDEYKRQINGFTAARTAGYHHGTLRVATTDIVKGHSGLSDTLRALGPTVKVIGHSKNGQPILVEESSARHGLAIADIPVSAIVGLVESGSPLEGIAQRKSATTSLMQYGETTDIPGGKYIFGVAGLAVDMAIPDLATLAGGAAGVGTKLTKLAAKGPKLLAKGAKGSKLLNPASTEAIAAKGLREAAETMREGVRDGNIEKIQEAQDIYGERVLGKLNEDGSKDFARYVDQVDETLAEVEFRTAKQYLEATNDLTGDALTAEVEAQRRFSYDVLTAAGSQGKNPIKKVITPQNIPEGVDSDVKRAFEDLGNALEVRSGVRRLEADKGPGAAVTTAKAGDSGVKNFAQQLRSVEKVNKALQNQGYYTAGANQYAAIYAENLKKAFKAKSEDLEALGKLAGLNQKERAALKQVKSTEATKASRGKSAKEAKIGWINDDVAAAIKIVSESKAGAGKHTDEAVEAAKALLTRRLIAKVVNREAFDRAVNKQARAEAANVRRAERIKKFDTEAAANQEVFAQAEAKLKELEALAQEIPADIERATERARLTERLAQLEKNNTKTWQAIRSSLQGATAAEIEKLVALKNAMVQATQNSVEFKLDIFTDVQRLAVLGLPEVVETLRRAAASYTKSAADLIRLNNELTILRAYHGKGMNNAKRLATGFKAEEGLPPVGPYRGNEAIVEHIQKKHEEAANAEIKNFMDTRHGLLNKAKKELLEDPNILNVMDPTTAGKLWEELSSYVAFNTDKTNVGYKRGIKGFKRKQLVAARKAEREARRAKIARLETEVKGLNAEVADLKKDIISTAKASTQGALAKKRVLLKTIKKQQADRNNLIRLYTNAIKKIDDGIAAWTKSHNARQRTMALLRKKMASASQLKVSKVPAKKEVIDATAATQRVQKLVTDIVESAQEATYKHFYGDESPLGEAQKQLDFTRKAILLNAERAAKALDQVAENIEQGRRVSATLATDTPEEIISMPGFTELFVTNPALKYDDVPNALILLANKSGRTTKEILGAIKKGEPLKVPIDGNLVTLDAKYLGDAQLAEEVKVWQLTQSEFHTIPLRGAIRSAPVTRATDKIDKVVDAVVAKSETLGQAVGLARSLLIGGSVDADMPALGKTIIETIKEVRRSVSQTISDTATFIKEDDFKGLCRYMGGENTQFIRGKHVLSSGGPSVPGQAALAVERLINSISLTDVEAAEDAKQLLRYQLNNDGTFPLETASNIHRKGYDALSKLIGSKGSLTSEAERVAEAAAEAARKAAKKARPDIMESDLLRPAIKKHDIITGDFIIDTIKAAQQGSANIDHKTFGLLAAMYKAGDKTEDAAEATETMLKAISRAYLEETVGGVVNRIAPIMSAHVSASSVIKRMGDYNLSLNKDDYVAFTRFIEGRSIADLSPDFREKVINPLVKMFGTTEKFAALDVMGETMYLPSSVRQNLIRSMGRALDQHIGMLSKSDNAKDTAKRTFDAFSALIYKTRIFGTFLFRSAWGVDMTFEGFESATKIGGLTPAMIHTTRMFSRWPSMFPGVLQAAHTAKPVGRKMLEYLGPPSDLDAAPGFVRTVAEALADGSEGLLRVSDEFGEAVVRNVFRFMGAGKWNVSVNKILAGSDELVDINGRMYSYASLREFFTARGVTGGSYAANYFSRNLYKKVTGSADPAEQQSIMSKVLGGSYENIMSYHKAVMDYAESLSERERISMAIAFMNVGDTPVEAARKVNLGLHDYQGTTSSMDYSVFFKMFLPFWGFTKNNNRLQLDTLLTPAWAYRSQMQRSFIEGGKDMFQSYLDSSNSDELGVQTQYMPPEDLERYELLKQTIKDKLGVKSFSEAETAVIKGMLLGIDTTFIHEGKPFAIDVKDSDLQEIRRIIKADKFMLNTPVKEEIVAQYYQNRPTLIIPQDIADPRTAARRKVSAPAEWNYIAFPEPGLNAFFQHFGAITSLGTALAGTIPAAIGYDPIPNEKEMMALRKEASTVFQPDFHPGVSLVLNAVGATTEEGNKPMYVPEGVGMFMQSMGADFVKYVPPVVVDGVVIKEGFAMLPSWAAAAAGLAPVPMGAFSDFTKLQRATKISASGDPTTDKLLTTLKLGGIRVERSDRDRVRRDAEPKRTMTTKTLPYD